MSIPLLRLSPALKGQDLPVDAQWVRDVPTAPQLVDDRAEREMDNSEVPHHLDWLPFSFRCY